MRRATGTWRACWPRRLFGIETYVGLAVAVLALLLPGQAQIRCGAMRAAALLAINEWVLKPVMMRGSRATAPPRVSSFGAWHGVSAVLYCCVRVLLLRWC